MPTIEINLKDLEKLLGKKLPRDTDKLNDVLQYAKAEVDSNILNDTVSINVEDSNRPDLWCVEGVARELRGALGLEKGLKKYTSKKSNFRVTVDKKLKVDAVFYIIHTWLIKNFSILLKLPPSRGRQGSKYLSRSYQTVGPKTISTRRWNSYATSMRLGRMSEGQYNIMIW